MGSSLFPVELVDALPGAPWLKQLRNDSAEKLRDAALPSAAEEIWRYSRIDDVDLSQFKIASGAGALADDVQKQIDALAADIGVTPIVTVDGFLSSGGSASAIVELTEPAPMVGVRDDVFVIANDAFASGLLIDIADKAQIETPILIVNVVSTADSLSFPRTAIRVGKNASAQVVECFISEAVNALTIPVVEIEVGQNSQLQHIVVQNLAGTVSSIGRQTSKLDRDATLSSANLVFGGDFARVRNDTELVGENSTSNLSAVYFGENNQMHDFRTLQEHVGRQTKSDLFFRGAVADQAHSVYSGLIRIRKGAHGTDAMQSNRTIKLSPEAIADSVPNLEIDENDVRCAHASAVGPIGEDERYYLESRGIPTSEADRLIVLGFLDQVFARIPIEGVVNYARKILQQKWEAHS